MYVFTHTHEGRVSAELGHQGLGLLGLLVVETIAVGGSLHAHHA